MIIGEKNYIDYADHFTIKDSVSAVNLGNIFMLLKANLLNEVIVKQSVAAIRMKGDTTEFTADSFKVRPGASVEEMLRTLPGLQVDKDGNITEQGQKVKKVLVDGEEFFGDDPTLATKNLPSRPGSAMATMTTPARTVSGSSNVSSASHATAPATRTRLERSETSTKAHGGMSVAPIRPARRRPVATS